MSDFEENKQKLFNEVNKFIREITTIEDTDIDATKNLKKTILKLQSQKMYFEEELDKKDISDDIKALMFQAKYNIEGILINHFIPKLGKKQDFLKLFSDIPKADKKIINDTKTKYFAIYKSLSRGVYFNYDVCRDMELTTDIDIIYKDLLKIYDENNKDRDLAKQIFLTIVPVLMIMEIEKGKEFRKKVEESQSKPQQKYRSYGSHGSYGRRK